MKCRLLKLLRLDVAWHRGRFLSTSAVCDNAIPTEKTRTRIPKSQRKALIVDYVTKLRISDPHPLTSQFGEAIVTLRYRAINEGKFPGATNIRNQVGGGTYTIRAILQELKYHSEHKDSLVQRAAQRNDKSAIKETVSNVLTVAEAEDCGDLSENGVLNEQVFVEKPSSDRTVMESATDFNLYEKSELPFQRPGLSSEVCVEINKPSGKCPDFTMGTAPKETQEKEIEETLWGNVKSMANRFISIWR